MPIHSKILHTWAKLKFQNVLEGVWNKNIAIKNKKNILHCAYWPWRAAMLSSEDANQEEDKSASFSSLQLSEVKI